MELFCQDWYMFLSFIFEEIFYQKMILEEAW